MRKLVLVIAVALVAGMPIAVLAQAQTAPAPARQRAPGVPLVPRSGEVARPPMPNSVAPRDETRGTGGDKAQIRSERDPPMPKPVPSIIAP